MFQPNYGFKKAQRQRVKKSRESGRDAGTPEPRMEAEPAPLRAEEDVVIAPREEDSAAAPSP